MNKFQLKPTMFGQDIEPKFEPFFKQIFGKIAKCLKIRFFPDFYLGNITTEQVSVQNYHVLSRYY